MKYTKEDILEIAKNYTHKKDFKQKEPKVYNIVRNNGWLKEVCGKMLRMDIAPKTKQECLDVALKYTKKIDFIKNENKYYQYCMRKGWLDEVTSHMKKNVVWNDIRLEEIKIEALKYRNKTDFRKHLPNHYFAAKRYGLFNELYYEYI
jgi:hypothetical protein